MRTPAILAAIVLITSAALVPASEAVARDSNGRWRRLDVGGTKPVKRKHHTMIHDASSSRTILFGGEGVNNVIFGDVWALSQNANCEPSWQLLTPELDPTYGSPGARHGHNAVYAADPPRMIVFGGRTGYDPSTTQSDIWSLSLTGTPQWTRLGVAPTRRTIDCSGREGCVPGYPGYPPRTHSAIALTPNGLTIFGGLSTLGGATLQDTWNVYLPNSWGYVSGQLCPFQLPPVPGFSCNNVPHRRAWHTMVLDGYNRLVVFGGYYPDDPTFNNTWVSADGGSTWNLLGSTPADPVDFRRVFHAAVFDPIGGRMVVVGGKDIIPNPPVVFGTVTAIDLPASLTFVPDEVVNPAHPWYPLTPTGTGPGPIAEHAIAYDPNGDRILVFGGVNADQGGDEILRDNDVWALEFDEAPNAVADLGSNCVGTTAAQLSFTAPGADGAVGTASFYDVRVSTSPITDANFASATPLTSEPPPAPAGSYVEVTASGLTKCKWYWFAMKSYDEDCNVSLLSNVYSVRTRCSGMGTCGTGEAALVTAAEQSEDVSSSGPGVRLVHRFAPDQVGTPYSLSIYDVTGRLVRKLGGGIAGRNPLELRWDLRTDTGGLARSGMYFARIDVGPDRVTKPVRVVR